MDGQRSFERLHRLKAWISTADWRDGNGFGFFDQAQRRSMQIAELGLARLIFGKLYQVAAFKKFGQAFLLVTGESICRLQFVEELFGGSLRRMKIKTFLQVQPNRIGNQDAELPR